MSQRINKTPLIIIIFLLISAIGVLFYLLKRNPSVKTNVNNIANENNLVQNKYEEFKSSIDNEIAKVNKKVDEYSQKNPIVIDEKSLVSKPGDVYITKSEVQDEIKTSIKDNINESLPDILKLKSLTLDETANIKGGVKDSGSAFKIDDDLIVTGSLNVHDTLYLETTDLHVGINTRNPDYSLDVDGTIRAREDLLVTNNANIDDTFYVDSSTDRVGIGTSTPSQKLDVNGATRIRGYLYANDGTNIHDTFYLETTNDRVGIGTSSPTQKLDVNGATRIRGYLYADDGINIHNTFYLETTNDRIGIGTTSPTVSLDVNDEARIRGILSANSSLNVGSSSQFVVNSTGNITRINNIPISFPATQGLNRTVLRNDGSGNLTWVDIIGVGGTLPSGVNGQTLRHNGTVWSANNLLFNSGTRIGIGTTIPTHTLEILGDSRITGSFIINNGQLVLDTDTIASPTVADMGSVHFDNTNNDLKIYTGSRWQGDRSDSTFIIAANDSKNKEKADYVCDGTNDQIEIQQAINDLPATGGKVTLLDGEFFINALTDIGSSWNGAVLINKDNVEITGNIASKIKFVDGITKASGGISMFYTDQKSNISVHNLYLNGNRQNVSSDYITAFYVRGDTGCKNIRLYQNTLANVKWGIYGQTSCDNTLISDNLFTGLGNSAPAIGLNDFSNKSIITNNIIESPSNGIVLNDTANSLITNNVINNSSGYAIYLEDNVDGVTISQNTISNSTGGSSWGIYINSSSDNNLITSNSINDLDNGIRVTGTNNTITNNKLISLATDTITNSGTNVIRYNDGFVTENSGTASVLTTTTYIEVTHGLGFTPNEADITVTPTNNMGDATKYWISDVTATTFRINVNVDPNTSNANFNWHIYIIRP